MTDDQIRPGDAQAQANDQTEANMRRALERIGTKTPREVRAAATPTFSGSPINRNGPDGQKRRFVRDGEVPVMVVSGSRPPEGQAQRRGAPPASEQVEAAQALMRAERAGHEAAERQLREARETIQDLRTKLGHIALARDEAIEAAKRAEMARAALAHELDVMAGRLAAEVSARAKAERRADQIAPIEIAPEPVVVEASAPVEEAAPRRRGRPRKVVAASDVVDVAVDGEAVVQAPRKRGRPPKAASVGGVEQPKRKPGRPRIEREPEPVKWWLSKK